MTAKETLAATLGSPDKLDAVREIIVGPLTRELEQKIAKLSRQIEQLHEQNQALRLDYEKKLTRLQAEYSEHLKRYARRAAHHRSRFRNKLKEMAAQLELLAGQSQADQENRLALAKTMATFARRLRAAPLMPAASSASPGRRKKLKAKTTGDGNGRLLAKLAKKANS